MARDSGPLAALGVVFATHPDRATVTFDGFVQSGTQSNAGLSVVRGGLSWIDPDVGGGAAQLVVLKGFTVSSTWSDGVYYDANVGSLKDAYGDPIPSFEVHP